MKSEKLPLETFLPGKQRFLAILQLCIAFSLICWYGAQPFMGEFYSLRSRMLVYEYVLGTSEAVQKDKLERNKERFASLQDNEKALILKDYKKIQNYAGRPFWIKIMDGLKKLFLEIPPFELAWLSFAIIISILLLLKVEGAKQAAWLLPIIVFAYSIDNRTSGHPSKPDFDSVLFPKESKIIQNYLGEPFSGDFLAQKEQLQKGWENYLITNWLPFGTSESLQRSQKIEEAEFAFTKARLHQFHKQPKKNASPEYVSYPLLAFYLIWNLFFAFRMSNNKGALAVLQGEAAAAQKSG